MREILRYTPTHAVQQEPMKSARNGNSSRTVSAALVPSSRTITRTSSRAEACRGAFGRRTIQPMEPITAATTAWTIAKNAGEIGKKLYELGKSLKDREAKQAVDDILDKLRDLKQSASELEDENRELREKLRFKSDAYEFRTPFWYDRANPKQPLCPKCFASGIPAPMGEPGQDTSSKYRRCLVCKEVIEVNRNLGY